jgi:hypothetical protein
MKLNTLNEELARSKFELDAVQEDLRILQDKPVCVEAARDDALAEVEKLRNEVRIRQKIIDTKIVSIIYKGQLPRPEGRSLLSSRVDQGER